MTHEPYHELCRPTSSFGAAMTVAPRCGEWFDRPMSEFVRDSELPLMSIKESAPSGGMSACPSALS